MHGATLALTIILSLSVVTARAAENDQFSLNLYRQKILTLPEIRQHKVRVAFFDADSTLRVSRSGLPWATTDRDYEILPGVIERLKSLNRRGYMVAIVSNQGRIPYSIQLREADQALMNMVQDLERHGALVNYFDFADKVDESRKPSIGMFTRLDETLRTQLDARIDRKNSFMVGDAAYTREEQKPDGSPGTDFSNADRLFAANAGIDFHYASDFFAWRHYGVAQVQNRFHARALNRRMKDCIHLLTDPEGLFDKTE